MFEIESHTAEDAGRATDRAAGGRALLMLASPTASSGGPTCRSPEWLFGWAATVVLIVSFVGLAVLWPQPRLQDDGSGAPVAAVARLLSSRAVEVCAA